MATEHEIERLLVRLVGNSDQFRKMLSEAQEEIKEVAEAVENAGDKVESIEDTINSLGESALVVGSALVGLGKALDQVSGKTTVEAIENAKQQEEATVGLISAIEASGRSVEKLLPRYQKWSAEMQELTVYGNEQIEMWLRYALTLGASGDEAMEAVKLGMAISESLGMSVQRSLRAATELQQGVLRGRILRQMPAHIKKIEDEGERAAEALRYMSKQFNLVENRAKTLTGSQKQLSETWADFIKAVGQELAPALLVVTKALRRVTKRFDSLPRPVKILVAGFFALVSVAAKLSTTLGSLLIATVVLEKAFIRLKAIKTTLLAVSKAVYATMLANPLIAVGAAITGVTYAVVRSTSMLAEFNAEQERAKQIADEWSGRQQRATDTVLELFNRMGREAGLAFLQEELSKLQEEWKTLAVQVNNSADAIEEAQNSWRHFFVGGITNEVEAMQTEHEALVQRLDDVGEAAERIGDALSKAQRASSLDMMLADLTLLNEELQHQIETWGMTEAEIARVKFVQAEDTEELERYIALLEKVEALKAADRQQEAEQRETDRQAEAVEKLIEGLEKQAETFGMSDRELALYEARLNVATKDQMRYIDALTKQVAQQTEFNDLQEEAARLVEDMQTPLERFAQQQQRYFKMLNAGLIDLDTYNAALKEARAVASEAFKIDFDVRGIEAVEWGSAAMHELMAEYEMGLQRPELPDIPEPEVSKEAQAIIDAQLHKDDRHEKTVEDILNKIFKSLDDRDALMIDAANLSNKS